MECSSGKCVTAISFSRSCGSHSHVRVYTTSNLIPILWIFIFPFITFNGKNNNVRLLEPYTFTTMMTMYSAVWNTFSSKISTKIAFSANSSYQKSHTLSFSLRHPYVQTLSRPYTKWNETKTVFMHFWYYQNIPKDSTNIWNMIQPKWEKHFTIIRMWLPSLNLLSSSMHSNLTLFSLRYILFAVLFWVSG